MSSKQSDFYKSYMETLQKKAKEAVSKAQEKTFEEYFEVADTKIRDITVSLKAGKVGIEPTFLSITH